MANVLTMKFYEQMLTTPRPETTNEGWLRRINNEKGKKGHVKGRTGEVQARDRHPYVYDLPSASDYKQDPSEWWLERWKVAFWMASLGYSR